MKTIKESVEELTDQQDQGIISAKDRDIQIYNSWRLNSLYRHSTTQAPGKHQDRTADNSE